MAEASFEPGTFLDPESYALPLRHIGWAGPVNIWTTRCVDRCFASISHCNRSSQDQASVRSAGRGGLFSSAAALWPSSLGMLIGPRPHHYLPIERASVHSTVQKESLVHGLETAVQAVVGSIVRAFRTLKKPRSREMSARGYALHSVWPQLPSPFPPLLQL